MMAENVYWRLLILVNVFIMGGGSVFAQGPDAQTEPGKEKIEEITEVLEDERLKEIKKEVEAIFKEVEAVALPPEPFISKVREGLAKKAKPEKIVAALKLLKVRYVKAFSMLKGKKLSTSLENLGAVADMLSGGVKEKSIKYLLAEVKDRGVAGHKHEIVLLSVYLLKLRNGGLEEKDALNKVIKLYREKGLDRIKKDIAKKKASQESNKSWNIKHGKKLKKGIKVKSSGGKKSGKAHGK